MHAQRKRNMRANVSRRVLLILMTITLPNEYTRVLHDKHLVHRSPLLLYRPIQIIAIIFLYTILWFIFGGVFYCICI